MFRDQLFLACMVLTALLRALSLPQRFDCRREQSQNSSQTPASFLHEKSLNTERNIKCTHTRVHHICISICISLCIRIFLYMKTPTHTHRVYTCTIKAPLLVRERFFPSSNSTKVTEMFN